MNLRFWELVLDLLYCRVKTARVVERSVIDVMPELV